MNPTLDETQLLLRDTLRHYLEAEVPFSRIRDHEESGKPDEALWSALIEQGWIGSAFPEAIGGGGGSLVEAGLIVEELARRAALVPGVEVIAATAALSHHGGETGAKTAREVLAGSCRPVPAVAESGDHSSRIEAEVDGAGKLHGQKRFVDYATFATHHLVAARQAGEPGLFLVASDDAAVSLDSTPCMGRTPQSSVRYQGAAAEPVGDADAVAFLVNLARALTAVQIVGCMQQSVEMTVAYTNVREQFGRPIATFQAVQHHGANMAMHTESNRFLCYEALEALERGDATDEQVAILKTSASRSVPEVTMLGHQLHGGQGFIEENDLYFFTIRGKDRALAWGSAEECLAIVAENAEGKARWL
jgi:alkylation response protein AidB-like acyl-CoA dehydrogenase